MSALRTKLLNFIDENDQKLGGDACELLHDVAEALVTPASDREAIIACVTAELAVAERSHFDGAIRTGVLKALNLQAGRVAA